MNKIVFISLFGMLSLFSTKAQESYAYWTLEQSLPDWAFEVFQKQAVSKSHLLSNYVNPFYFEADFNGDNSLDIALLIEEKSSQLKGILIIHGETNQYFVLGAGKIFDNRIDDFSWMDVWKLYRHKKAYELIISDAGEIEGDREFVLPYTGIEIIALEASSGLIYWDGKQYLWAQMSD
ncbi:MAG: hypothetical protein KKC03_00405 [Bacteroidetes bacterium]|nr:hypothetical protein [Bacteroidota bacterium]